MRRDFKLVCTFIVLCWITRPLYCVAVPSPQKPGHFQWIETLSWGSFSGALSNVGVETTRQPLLAANVRRLHPYVTTERRSMPLKYSEFISFLDGLQSHGLWSLKGRPAKTDEIPKIGYCLIGADYDNRSTVIIIRLDDPANQGFLTYIREKTVLGKVRERLLHQKVPSSDSAQRDGGVSPNLRKLARITVGAFGAISDFGGRRETDFRLFCTGSTPPEN